MNLTHPLSTISVRCLSISILLAIPLAAGVSFSNVAHAQVAGSTAHNDAAARSVRNRERGKAESDPPRPPGRGRHHINARDSFGDRSLMPAFPQKPLKCKHEPVQSAPKYRIASSVYSVEGPRTLFLSISIAPKNFTHHEMIALARLIKADLCDERNVVVAILDNHQAARAWAPTFEKTWPQQYWRGTYFLDLSSGEEWIEFSTMPDRPKNEVKINLASSGNRETKSTAAAAVKRD